MARISPVWLLCSILATGAAAAVTTDVRGQDATFGTEEDLAYASDFWNTLNEARLAGEGAIQARPYEGTEPHGAVLQTLKTMLTVGDHEGQVIVKRNYGPAEVTLNQVWTDPDQHLGSVTVMFKREEGYAPDSGNWFWAKYLPDGSLDQTGEGVKMTGRVAGCIGCHAQAEGGDFIYTNDQ